MATTYETRTQTRTDRYGGYSSYSPRYEEETTNYEPQSFVEYEDNDDTAFEVQKNYSFGVDEDIVQEEQTRSMAMPEVIRSKRAIASPVNESKIKIRARGKIAIAVYSIILATLIAFAIYNAVAISNLQGTVAAKNQTYISQSLDINTLLDEYNRLGSDDRILADLDGTFVEPNQGDIVRVSKKLMEKRDKTEVETNWFEELCEFLSGLFS